MSTPPRSWKSRWRKQAGIGWQGKHTNLVSRDFGSWLFLGEIYLSLVLEPDPPEADHCGSCRRCLDICPTAAFPAPHRLDARRCISYLTIEHKGMIPVELRPLIGNRVYGCDDCLAVCPWNKFAQQAHEPDFLPRADLTAPRLAELAALDDAGFRRMFAGSPIKRTGRDRFLRNVLIAIGNAGPGHPELTAAARRCLDDAAPLVRAAAVWAFSRLSPPGLSGRVPRAGSAAECDPLVRAEWERETGRAMTQGDGCVRRIRPPHSGAPSTTEPRCESSATLMLLCLCAAGCTPYIPVKDEFGVSALNATGDIPPEFAAFNRYDPRINPLLADQMCATPYQIEAVKALEAEPGEILAAQARCATYNPFYANLSQHSGQ